MSIKKVTLASLILLGLTACSSGGSGGSSSNVAKPNTKPQTTQQQTDKTAAEKAAKEKAEAERLAAEKAAKEKAEAERLAAEKAAKEKAEAERLAAEKAAKEKAEAERLAAEKAAKEKAEAERLAVEKAAKEKAEAERLAAEKAAKEKAEAERLAAEKAAKEKAEAERLAAEKAEKEKAEAERLAAEKAAKEKAEAERLAAEKAAKEKAEAERLAAEKAEQERQAKIAQLKPIAVEAGLDEGTAEYLADQNSSRTPDEFKKIAEDYKLQRDIDTAKGFSKNTYSQGFNYEGYSPSRSSSSSCVNFRCTTWDGTTDSGKTVYNQKYSVVVGSYDYRNGRQNGYYVNENSFDVEVKGLKTSNEAIPTEGSATYTGKAFRAKEVGDLTYNVNFQERNGEGKVTGLNVGTLNLDKGDIQNARISSTINQDEVRTYSLEFFGPKAEEVSGSMNLGDPDSNYGLAGTRGDIQK